MVDQAKKIQQFYILAVFSISVILLFNQLLFQIIINRDDDYSRRINIAGRQRMLSQKLVKSALAFSTTLDTSSEEENRWRTEMRQTFIEFSTAQTKLTTGSADMGIKPERHEDILKMFKDIQPEYNSMLQIVGSILEQSNKAPDNITMNRLLIAQQSFLNKMEEIVAQLDKDASTQLSDIKIAEVGLTAFALLVILLEVLFVFRPVVSKLNTSLKELSDSRMKLESANKELAKALEIANTSNMVKEQFLTNISHEIRTPMNGIIGMTGLLRSGKLDAEQKENLDIIERSSEDLLHVINNILDFSKAEAGKLGLVEHPYELSVLIKEVFDALQADSQKKGIELLCDIDHAIPAVLLIDGARLKQILMNLVGNAVKFTIKGTVRVSLILLEKQKNQVSIEFHIQDTGVGIAPEKVAIIFEPFGQADGSITREHTGLGLGLNISKNLIELMNGTLKVKSKADYGSDFFFSLRLKTP